MARTWRRADIRPTTRNVSASPKRPSPPPSLLSPASHRVQRSQNANANANSSPHCPQLAGIARAALASDSAHISIGLLGNPSTALPRTLIQKVQPASRMRRVRRAPTRATTRISRAARSRSHDHKQHQPIIIRPIWQFPARASIALGRACPSHSPATIYLVPRDAASARPCPPGGRSPRASPI